MGKSLRVLIVEDSEDDALLVIRELERGGYEATFERVETAAAMAAALEKQAWDIIIADYKLPHFSAPEALKLFHQSGLDLPFIAVSGTIGEETAVETMKAGAHDYLMKGNLARLVPAIERELREAEVRKQHKQVEEMMRESEEKYRRLFELGSDALFLIEVKTGKILDLNNAAIEMYGYSRKEALQMKTTDFSTEPDKTLKATLESKKYIPVRYHRRKDGTIFPTDISVAYYTWYGKEVCVAAIRDTTERKKVEEQLIVADRLASIGELSSGIAHELNDPLTGIISLSELVLDRDLPDEVKEDIVVINKEAQRTSEVVKNLLTFARKHPKEKHSVDINHIIQQVLKLRAYEQKVSNIEVNTQLDADLPKVMANGFELQQVFLNLIINAEYFMKEAHGRGTLTITTERVKNIVRASFADNGPGISPENLSYLFNPFFTTKEVGKGTGLGLSICHGIVSGHDGRIDAESELGKGTTFIVELPIISKAEELKLAEPAGGPSEDIQS